MSRPALGILLLALVWGGSYALNEVALRGLDPWTISWARITLGALVIWPLAIAAGGLGALRSHARPLAVTGVIQIATPISLITVGQQWIPSSLAGVLNGSVPIFVAVLAIGLDRAERATGLRVVGVALGFAGVVAVYGLEVGGDRYAIGGALCLTGSSIFYALGPLYAKSRLAGVPQLGLVASILTAASLATAVPGLANLSRPTVPELGAVVALGVVSTGLAFALYYAVMMRIGPGRTSVVAYLIPGFAVIYGAVLLDEPIGDGIAAGLLLIAAGSYLTARRPRVAATSTP